MSTERDTQTGPHLAKLPSEPIPLRPPEQIDAQIRGWAAEAMRVSPNELFEGLDREAVHLVFGLTVEEISNMPILHPTEERQRAAALAQARHLRARLASDQNADPKLLQEALDVEAYYRTQLAEPHIRMVVFVAKKYSVPGLDIKNLLESGYKGLLKATEEFVLETDVRFAPYATWWIRQSIAQPTETFPEQGRTEPRAFLPSHQEPTADELREVETRFADILDNNTDIYFQEIRRAQLLTARDEINLAIVIARGAEAARLIQENVHKDDRVLTQDESARLSWLISQGDRARVRMIEANLRWAAKLARKFMDRGLDLNDLIQEANIGLVKAVEKFDHRKGFRFTTYASWWIKQSITRAIAEQARTIRIPVHFHEVANRLIATEKKLTAFLQRDPTSEEIAEEMQITPEEVEQIRQRTTTPVSLDSPIGDDNEVLGNLIADETDEIIKIEKSTLRQMLVEEMSGLKKMEREVLNWRFGLSDGRHRTLEEVGKIFGVTRERIRQIEVDALRKLRKPASAARLKDYLD